MKYWIVINNAVGNTSSANRLLSMVAKYYRVLDKQSFFKWTDVTQNTNL